MDPLTVAGRRLRLRAPCGPLTSIPRDACPLPSSPDVPSLPQPGWSARARGLVGDRFRQVDCLEDAAGYRVEVRDLAAFHLAADGGQLDLRWTAEGVTLTELESAVLGPPLILALALQSTFCLHAGGVALGGAVAAFAGAPGAGKSTLVQQLLGALPGASRVADDVLPWATTGDDDRVSSLPYYPQPKLPDAQQPWQHLPPRLPLASVFVLAGDGHRVDRVSCTALSPARAVTAWLEQTMAVSLFPPPLLHRHLEVCTRAAASVPTYELRYPWRAGSEAVVAELVVERLQQG